MKKNYKSILVLVLIIAAVILGVSVISSTLLDDDKLTYSDVRWYLEEDLVKSFVLDGNGVLKLELYEPEKNDDGEFKREPQYNNKIAIVHKNGKPVYHNYSYELGYGFQPEEINELAWRNYQNYQKDNSRPGLEEYNYEPSAGTPWYQIYLPYIIVALLFGGLWFFLMRQAPGGGKMNTFSKSKAKVNYNDKDPVKFSDVAGADEEKAELEEVVEFLKDPAKFVKLGARIPRGVLLVGPPGTGKTLLAKAVAGEAGVPFFSISGSDFVEMYVGVGASRVRDLFENARRTPASIIFIDEIDAVGRHRGAGLGGGHDEREQTLNQLLVEMDGFGTNSGVIVMAATNRPDILDPALLRPGRFDRRVTVNYPDMNGREAILRVHTRNKPLEETVDLRKIAQTTIGFTGADLANLMNEAALLAAKKNKALIGMEDIEESYMKLLLGPQKKSKLRTDDDNKLCAYHEAGHAVASYYCKHTDPVKHITIIPAGSAGGVTISVPTEDRMTNSKKQMIDKIIVDLGGRVAEEIVLDDISTGASSDIQNATSIARNMVTRFGMSEKLGTVLYGSEHSSDEVFLGRDFSSGKNYSEKTAAEIDEEIRSIINSAYETCKKYLTENISKLHFVAEFLLKNESMDEEQFKAAMEMDNPTIEEIEQIAVDKKKKSEAENKTAHENNAKAEAEAKARAEAEAAESDRIAREAFGASTGFSSDDFFKNVWQAPAENEEANEKKEKSEENSDSSDDSDKQN
ncbi:MAG: ATP-dependent zinc metalloprotease FtsH [Ruminococcaceae bacterium]|nr:ATP-dependent zinc metalloprotease FtsH [Oscillospiraceae bacterium]